MFRYPFRELNYPVPEAYKFSVNFTVELTDISEGSVGTKENCNTLIIWGEKEPEVIERADDASIIKTSTKVSIEFIRKNITKKSCWVNK